jgi:Ni/Co efflux regulator RcnB
MLGRSSVGAQLAASQEGLGSVDPGSQQDCVRQTDKRLKWKSKDDLRTEGIERYTKTKLRINRHFWHHAKLTKLRLHELCQKQHSTKSAKKKLRGL